MPARSTARRKLPRLHWPVALGVFLFVSHQFLRFCFDWGGQPRFGIAHALVLIAIGALSAVPTQKSLTTVHLFWSVTALLFFIALLARALTPPATGAWSPFADAMLWVILLPAALSYGILGSLVFSHWLKGTPSPAASVQFRDIAVLVFAFPLSAALQFLLGSLPGLFLGTCWEQPTHPRQGGFAPLLYTWELWAWLASCVAVLVWYIGMRNQERHRQKE